MIVTKLNAMPVEGKKELMRILSTVELPLDYTDIENIQHTFETETNIQMDHYGVDTTTMFALLFTKLYKGLINPDVSLFANPDASSFSDMMTLDHTKRRENYHGELI